MTNDPAHQIKALHDALLNARTGMSVLVNYIKDLKPGEQIPSSLLSMLDRQYCGPAEPIDTLEVVVRSRKQFDEISIEVMDLRHYNEQLLNHIKVAREERDELIQAAKK